VAFRTNPADGLMSIASKFFFHSRATYKHYKIMCDH